MLSTHQERELRATFSLLMEPDLDLYDLQPEMFERVIASFILLHLENQERDTNYKVYKVRVEGRNVHLLSR